MDRFMDERTFEKLLGYHCGPTLKGLKSGNIFSVKEKESLHIRKLIQKYQERLAPFGLVLEVLCGCEDRMLLYLYRPLTLMEDLSKQEMQIFLQSMGYPSIKEPAEVVAKLKERINQGGEFPHEIGAFLSYPLEDIQGFIRFKGKYYHFNGYWKVYEKPEKKAALFQEFSKCRTLCCKELSQGKTLIELLVTTDIMVVA